MLRLLPDLYNFWNIPANAPCKCYNPKRHSNPSVHHHSFLIKVRSMSRSRSDIVFQFDTHGGQLDIQVLQHARNSNDGGIIATNPSLAFAIFPDFSLPRPLLSSTRTSSAPHDPSTFLASSKCRDRRLSRHESTTLFANP